MSGALEGTFIRQVCGITSSERALGVVLGRCRGCWLSAGWCATVLLFKDDIRHIDPTYKNVRLLRNVQDTV